MFCFLRLFGFTVQHTVSTYDSMVKHLQTSGSGNLTVCCSERKKKKSWNLASVIFMQLCKSCAEICLASPFTLKKCSKISIVFLISIRTVRQEFFLISIGSMHQNQHGAVCNWRWRCRGRVAWVVPWSAVAHLTSASLTCVRSGLTSFHLTLPLATEGAATL